MLERELSIRGGPKREFFRLFAEQASTYFRGDDGQPKFIRNDTLAVQVRIACNYTS